MSLDFDVHEYPFFFSILAKNFYQLVDKLCLRSFIWLRIHFTKFFVQEFESPLYVEYFIRPRECKEKKIIEYPLDARISGIKS